jgi:HAD superfamily hydrolase (TIGR01490 family)
MKGLASDGPGVSSGRRTMEHVEAAFFDLDKTIISKSSSLALSRPMYRAGLVSRSAILRGAYAQLVYLLVGADERKMEKAKEAMLALSRGWERSTVEELVADVLIRVIDPFVYQEALDLIALHRALGRRVYIVSSSPEEVVRPLAAHFDITDVIATRAEVVDGKYTGELAFYCYGDGKAEAIRQTSETQNIDLARSYAYSDSVTDLPMLRAVGHPVAVNPDRDLRREAEANGWQIRDFRRPVRMRTRLASVPRPPTPIAAAVAAAIAAIIVGWIFLRPRVGRGAA